MASFKKIEEISEKFYEKWKDPHNKDNYTAEDMRRAFERGMLEAVAEVIVFLEKKDAGDYISSITDGVGVINFHKDKLLSDIRKHFENGTLEQALEEHDIKFLTREEVAQRLKDMIVGVTVTFPIKAFNFIVPNPDYDPENFDESIDGKPDFYGSFDEDYEKSMFRLIHYNVDTKAKKWMENHSKICPLKYIPAQLLTQCENHEDGTRNYYSEEILDKIMNWGEKHGGIVDFN